MFFHYLKVAFRNLLKYKTQSLITLLSLGISLACVTLAGFWNHYEMSYDSFLSNAERIYRVRGGDNVMRKVLPGAPQALAGYLKESYPEVEKACAVDDISLIRVSVDNVTYPREVNLTRVTPEVLDIFDVEWLEGDKNIADWNNRKIAISQEVAQYLCGSDSPVGKQLIDGAGETYEIAGVFQNWPTHSNLRLEVIGKLELDNNRWLSWANCYILLRQGANSGKLVKKLQADSIQIYSGKQTTFDVLTPIKSLHYTHPYKEMNVRIEDIHLFGLAAGLLALCALLNYLTLFVSRLRNRGRDMALRAICGSSGWQTGLLLMTEYSLLLLGALLLSTLFVEVALNKFMELAMIAVERSSVYQACLLLLLFVLLLAMLLSAVPIYYFRKKTLRVQIEAATVPWGNNRFRLMSISVQLIISMLFMFCSVVMMKQTYELLSRDINIERKDIATISSKAGNFRTMDILRQIPAVTEMVQVDKSLLGGGEGISTISEWDEKPANASPIQYDCSVINDTIARIYGLKMKEGTYSFELSKGEVIINESFAKAMNVSNPIGKILKAGGGEQYKIKGIVHDFQFQPPTKTVIPYLFIYDSYPPYLEKAQVVFKYRGDWVDCCKKIANAFKGVEVPDYWMKLGLPKYTLDNAEEIYRAYLEPEYKLLKLLGVVTITSLLIALFGIYAQIVQSCEHHRKEIAIRRVNGAQVSDILLMFFKQYMLQVVIAALVSFPIGYYLMKRWIEKYTYQTEIGFGIFAGILFGIAVLVTLCIGWHVWRAANENPAKVIKKE